MSKTAGNLHAGKTTFSSLGSNIQYDNLCIAENEEALPAGWQPTHVMMGAKLTDSMVSVGTGWSYISSVGEAQRWYPPQYLIRDYMRALSGMGATIIMDPAVAGILHDEPNSFATKRDLSKWLADNVEKTVASYWGNGVVSTMNTSMAIQGLDNPNLSSLSKSYKQVKDAPDTLMKPFQAGGINIVVAGAGQTTWFVTDFRVGRGNSVDAWR